MFWEVLLRDLRGEWKNRNIPPKKKKKTRRTTIGSQDLRKHNNKLKK
jgi:hypothetical protein